MRSNAAGRVLAIVALAPVLAALVLAPATRSGGSARAAMTAAAAPEALVWPAPPEPPRVRYLRSLASGSAAAGRRAWVERLRRIVVGERASRLSRPIGLCVGGDGTVLVCDAGSSTVYQVSARDGPLRPFASGGHLVTPVGVARLPGGEVWVADADRAVIVRYDERGRWQGDVGGGTLVRPTGIAYDATRDRLYVADSQAHRISVFDARGLHLGDLGRRGTAAGEFNFPTDVKVTAGGTLVVCDALNCRIQRLSPDGAPLGQFGRAGDARGDFARPKGVAVDAGGHVYVVDTLFDVVQIFDEGGRLLLVVGGSGAGAGQLNLPTAIAIDAADHIYVSDSANRRLQVFEYLGDAGGLKR